MKITSVECYLGNYIFIKINTDEGISGFGEAGLAYGDSWRAAFGQCQDFAKKIIGLDPFNTEEIWEHLHRHTFWGMGGGVVVTSAMSAIDIACWDIKGKALNVPVYKLLGGKTNKKLRAYASQLQFGWRSVIKAHNGKPYLLHDPQEYYDVVKDAMSEGYDAVKIDPLFSPYGSGDFTKAMTTYGTHYHGCMKQHEINMAVDRIKAAREAGGSDLDIIVEIHSTLDTNTAVSLGRALEPLNIMYYEEPTSPENPATYKFIKAGTSLPLATGERSYTRWGYRQFFEDRTLSIIQPDICNTGGITEAKKICDMAAVYDIGVQIHVCGGPISTAAALQLEASIPNFVIHEEHDWNLVDNYVNAATHYYCPKNGYYDIPELPGIGLEMTEEEMAKSEKVLIK